MLRDPEDALAEIIVDTVATAVAPLLADVTTLRTQVAALEARWSDNAALRERVAVLETRAPIPGPAGKDGEPGPPGKDGTAGLTYRGVYQEGKRYELGDVVTWAGSAWHTNEATTTKPGESAKAWTLMVKHGRDGKP